MNNFIEIQAGGVSFEISDLETQSWWVPRLFQHGFRFTKSFILRPNVIIQHVEVVDNHRGNFVVRRCLEFPLDYDILNIFPYNYCTQSFQVTQISERNALKRRCTISFETCNVTVITHGRRPGLINKKTV